MPTSAMDYTAYAFDELVRCCTLLRTALTLPNHGNPVRIQVICFQILCVANSRNQGEAVRLEICRNRGQTTHRACAQWQQLQC